MNKGYFSSDKLILTSGNTDIVTLSCACIWLLLTRGSLNVGVSSIFVEIIA